MKLLTGEKLIEYSETIQSKQDFEYFLECFVEDYRQNREDWENQDLLSYLEGLNGFINDMTGYYENRSQGKNIEDLSWRTVAEILIAASVYEG